MYRDKRERNLRVTDRIIHTTSRYMLGNVAISLICGTVYGVTALLLGLPYPLALAVIAAVLDLVPSIGAATAGLQRADPNPPTPTRPQHPTIGRSDDPQCHAPGGEFFMSTSGELPRALTPAPLPHPCAAPAAAGRPRS